MPYNSVEAQIIDNITDNCTDNTSDNCTDNQTLLRLYALFSTARDNFSCENSYDLVKFPNYSGLSNCVYKHYPDIRGSISCEDAASLTKLECNDPIINSLDGLQQFPNLEIIFMPTAGSEISDLSPIRNLKKLRTVSIPNSNISEIGWLVYLDNLTSLNLIGNSVTNLEFFPLFKRITNLLLDYQAPTYITDIKPLSVLHGLATLSLQGNRISDITALDNLTNINNLMLRDNRITSLEPIDNLTKLTSLNFSVNIISDISPLDNLTDLTYIAGNSNRITDLSPLDNLTKLQDISFKNNFISSVLPIANKSSIRAVQLDYNGINDLSPIFDIMLYTRLSELGLAYNCISKDNYRKVVYLQDIQTLRLDHQCESYPLYYPEDDFVVNDDLVNAQDVIDSDTIPKHETTSGVACSISQGKFNDLIVVVFPILLVVYLLLRRRIKNFDIK